MLDEVIQTQVQTNAEAAQLMLPDTGRSADELSVEAVLSGDDTGFTDLFERHKRSVTRIAGRFFRERDDIEEVVQQAFTKAYFSLKHFAGEGHGSFPAWISRIAVNVCYDEFRRRARKGESRFSEISEEELDHLKALADGRTPPVDSSLSSAQIAEKVLGGLKIKDRIAVTLVYSEDYSLDEAAEMLGMSTSSLKSRLFRCRSGLKARFGYLFR
jgi:RNA polymerase sigma-70 factor, ECF subfamily